MKVEGNIISGEPDEAEEGTLAAILPSQADLHLPLRARFGLLSNLLDLMSVAEPPDKITDATQAAQAVQAAKLFHKLRRQSCSPRTDGLESATRFYYRGVNGHGC